MAVVKVIEIMTESPESWEKAAHKALSEASKTLKNIQSIYIKEFSASVKNNQVESYRINAKVSFILEEKS